MKNFIKLLIALVVAFFVTTVTAFAQNEGTIPMVEQISLLTYAMSFLVIVTAVLCFTNLVNKLTNLSGFLKQFSSWIIAISLSFFGWLFQAGMFYETNWRMIIVYGLLCGWIANAWSPWFKGLKISFKITK